MSRVPDDPFVPLVSLFLARSKSDLATMREALGCGDFARVDALAHRMVGAAGAFALATLAEAARDALNAARDRDAHALGTRLDALARRLEEAVREAPHANPGAAG